MNNKKGVLYQTSKSQNIYQSDFNSYQLDFQLLPIHQHLMKINQCSWACERFQAGLEILENFLMIYPWVIWMKQNKLMAYNYKR